MGGSDVEEKPRAADESDPARFERMAAGRDAGLLAEFWGFLRHNKKWWLLPILVVIGLFGLLVFLAGTGLAPFLYPLF